MRMIAARFISDLNCGTEIDSDHVSAKNDTILAIQAIISEVRHTCSSEFQSRMRV